MNDMSEYFPTAGEVETRAITAALGLLAAVADPKGAKARLEQLASATAAYTEQREAAEQLVAEADRKQSAAEAATVELDKRTESFQLWSDATERAYREREQRILENEEAWAKRNAALDEREADLDRKVREHDALRQRLKEYAA